MIGFDPTEEQQLVIETVRQFAAKEIRPQSHDADEAEKLPEPVLAQAHELGLVANALPEAHGGGGERSAVTAALVAEELAWGDLAIALAILSPGLVALPVADFGSEAQREAVLPSYLGERFVPGALALLEPHFGADPFRPATTARHEGDAWVLDGAKCLVPWIDGDDRVLVVARREDAEGADAFLVPRDAEGLAAERERYMGIHALPTVGLTLSGVRVGADARLGGERGADLRALVARGRVALAACGIGVARAAFEIARDYAKEREVFGTKVAQKQAIAFKLADMAIEIDGARLLLWEAASRLDERAAAGDAGGASLPEATMAADQVRRVALGVCDGAVQVLGGHGYIRDYLPELHLRNARGLAVFEAPALV